MSKVIYKYQLRMTRQQTVWMPYEAEILHVRPQKDLVSGDDVITVWAAVDREKDSVDREFRIVETGGHVPEDGKYLGTVMTDRDSLVWHIYDLEY